MEKQPNRIKRLLSFADNYSGLLVLSRILSGISSVFILAPFLCVYFAASELVAVFTGSSINTDKLIMLGLVALGTEFIGLLLYFCSLLASHVTAFNIEKNLKMTTLKHLAKMPMGYFDANPSGQLRKIIDENSFQTQTFVAHQLPDLVGAQVTMIVSLILMLAFDLRIGIPLLLLFGIGFYLQKTLMGKDSMQFMMDYQTAQGNMNHEAVEYIRGISVVKIFGQTVASFTKFNKSINEYRDYAFAYTMCCKKGLVAFNSVINSGFLVLIPTALIVGFTSSDLVTFTQNFLFYLIFSPACAVMLNKIMYMSSYKMMAEESMRRIDLILLAPTQSEGTYNKELQNCDVTFDDVTFTYETAETPAITNISFTAKNGTTTALVGHSGSGKSTIASLIPRFYDVQSGAIKIGDVNIKDIPSTELMKNVAFVFQNPKLFKDSLLENIKAGRTSATKEEVLKAASLAQCDDIFAKFPDGIDTIVGSKGVYLSGGEIQRIAIARAILKDSPIIILDEATAYADPENEYEIGKALQGLTKGKTVIKIAHRLSTVQDAEQIIVLKNGEIVEKGTHKTLVENKKEYYVMWDNYTKSTEWHIGNEVVSC